MKPLFPYRVFAVLTAAILPPFGLVFVGFLLKYGRTESSLLLIVFVSVAILSLALGLWVQNRWAGITYVALSTGLGLAYNRSAFLELNGLVLLANLGLSLPLYAPLIFALKTRFR